MLYISSLHQSSVFAQSGLCRSCSEIRNSWRGVKNLHFKIVGASSALSLDILSLEFQAHKNHMLLYSMVCVGPVRELQRRVLQDVAYIIIRDSS